MIHSVLNGVAESLNKIYMSGSVLLKSSLTDLPVKRGKVSDMYDLGDRMLMVSTEC